MQICGIIFAKVCSSRLVNILIMYVSQFVWVNGMNAERAQSQTKQFFIFTLEALFRFRHFDFNSQSTVHSLFQGLREVVDSKFGLDRREESVFDNVTSTCTTTRVR